VLKIRLVVWSFIYLFPNFSIESNKAVFKRKRNYLVKIVSFLLN
jgi:hypothetical protein